jgi:hypothetical protein
MVMLEDKEIIRIISDKGVLEDVEVCMVIQRYIFDKKGVEVWVKPDFNSIFSETLFFQAMYVSFRYYYLKFSQDEKIKV